MMTETFYPGDIVRFLDEEGEGKVIGYREELILVETTEGFEIPYPASALVLTGRENSRQVKQEESSPETSRTRASREKYGLYIAYLKRESSLWPVFLINNTRYQLHFAMSSRSQNEWEGRTAGILSPSESVELLQRNRDELNAWPELRLDLLFFEPMKAAPEPRVYFHKPSAKSFVKAEGESPIRQSPAHVFQLDKDEQQAEKLAIKEKLHKSLDKPISKDSKKRIFVKTVIDLHSDKIPHLPDNIQPNELLQHQLAYAEKMLDKAVEAGLDKITFIHGAGSGKLKKAIQDLGSDHPHVPSTGKADPKLYGEGATFMKIH